MTRVFGWLNRHIFQNFPESSRNSAVSACDSRPKSQHNSSLPASDMDSQGRGLESNPQEEEEQKQQQHHDAIQEGDLLHVGPMTWKVIAKGTIGHISPSQETEPMDDEEDEHDIKPIHCDGRTAVDQKYPARPVAKITYNATTGTYHIRLDDPKNPSFWSELTFVEYSPEK